MNPKKLTKGRNRMLCGVCSGLAEYLNIDVTVVRLVAVVLTLFTCVGIVAYLVGAVIMPEPGPTDGYYDENGSPMA